MDRSVWLVPKPKHTSEEEILRRLALNGPSSMYRISKGAGKGDEIPFATVLRKIEALKDRELIELIETGKRGAQIYDLTPSGITYCCEFNILSPSELVRALTKRTSVGKILCKIPEVSNDLESFVPSLLFGAMLSLNAQWRVWETMVKEDPSIAKHIVEEPERLMKYVDMKRVALAKAKRGVRYAMPAFSLKPPEYAERLYEMIDLALLFRYLPSLTEDGKKRLSKLLSSDEEYKRLRDIMAEWKNRFQQMKKFTRLFEIIIEERLNDLKRLRQRD